MNNKIKLVEVEYLVI